MTNTESGETITKHFIPGSIRDKNSLPCSDDSKEDNRIFVVMQCTLDPHKKYKLEQATDMKERLSPLFLNVTFKYDKSIHIIKKNKKKYCLTP